MEIPLLINKAKAEEILQVSIGYDENQFNVFIREAQDFDLKPLMCEAFYYDLVKNKDNAPYKALIDGEEYLYENRDYFHRGIGDVLVYFTYSRFILKSNNVSTSHGFVQKKTQHSEPLSLEEKRNYYYKYKSDANLIFEDIIKFIERKIDLFDSWNECDENCETQTKTSGYKTRVIQ